MTENIGGSFSIDAEQGFLVLEDEEGNQARFFIEDDLDLKGKRYLILCHEEEQDTGEYIALRVGEDDEGDTYLTTVEDETELNRIQEALDEFDLEDEDEE